MHKNALSRSRRSFWNIDRWEFITIMHTIVYQERWITVNLLLRRDQLIKLVIQNPQVRRCAGQHAPQSSLEERV